MLHAMIMAGGGGTRFWPRSRQVRPKQFLALGGGGERHDPAGGDPRGGRTLLQQACDRLDAQVPPERTWVITSAAHVDDAGRGRPQGKNV